MVNWWYNRISIHLKKPMVIIGFLLLIINLKAQQNLVPNSRFDSYTGNCPSNFNQINSWFGYLSPDVFHYCLPSNLNGIPQNLGGYQYPISDSVYVGFYFYIFNTSNTREYIGVRLNDILYEGFTYCVEFHVSLADSSNYGINKFGAQFSIDSLGFNCPPACILSYQPQVKNDSSNIVTDKQNWVKISGSFVASGGEQFLTIGNFYDDIETAKHSIKVSNYPNNDYAYYYIDNVSVYACDSPLVEEPQDTTFVFIPNVFSPNQDGENDLWQVTANKVNNLNIQVFNRWGEQVYKTNLANTEEAINFNPAWDGYTPTGKPVSEGTYFYIVQYTLPSGETKVEKGNLTLIR